MTDVDFPDALPAGHRLHWYVLERVLGQGGFGITYLAHDSNLDRPVAIKEYLPSEIARRRADASARPHTEAHAERFAWGLERFLAEARTLARFDHPNIVRVLSVFEANNTAYMVMRFEEGEDLATLLERRGTLPERQLTDCLLPILDGLARVHATGFIHRDIKPENIYVRKDGSPVLLDFGSARQSFGSAKTMTILVAPGYAPLEQYYGDASTQGPWTDIYGLGATCYRAIAGQAPLDAVARAKGVLGSAREMLQPAVVAGRGRYGERLLEAVDHALQLSERDRPQTIADWRREIVAPATAGDTTPAAPATTAPASAPVREGREALVPSPPVPSVPAGPPVVAAALRVRSMPRPSPWLWGGAAGICALAAIVYYLLPARTAETKVTVASPQAPVSAASPASAPPAVAATLPASDAAARLPGTTTALATPAAPTRVAVVESPAASRSAAAPAHALVASRPVPRSDARTPSTVSAPIASSAASRALAAPAPALNKAVVALESPTLAAPSMTQAPSVVVAAVASAPSTRSGSARSPRDEQIDAGEAALRRGDAATAVQLLAPWAAAGVPRAQALLGRAQEARSHGQQNIEAYVWYGLAARAGQAEAASLRDKVGAKLQPAEINQAEQMIERWKPRPEPGAATTADRASP